MPDYISKMKPNGATGPEYNIKDAEAREVLSGLVEDLQEIDTPDNEPFLYRSLKGGGDRFYLNELVGGSVAWNQLLVSEHKQHSYNPTSAQGSYDIVVASNLNIPIIQGHKYLLSAKMTRTISGNNMIALVLWSQNAASQPMIMWNNGDANGYKQVIFLPYSNQTSFQKIAFNNYSGKQGFAAGDTMEYDDFYVIDLTQMFGTTIADYVYSLEQATAGSGIAWIKSYGFFTKDYYSYDAGSIKSVETSGKKYVGKNRWSRGDVTVVSDERFVLDKPITETFTLSLFVTSTDTDASTCISLLYYEDGTTGNEFLWNRGSRQSHTFTINKAVTDIRFYSSDNYNHSQGDTSTWKDIQLEVNSSMTPYEPYKSAYYDIYDIELRGIPTLQSNKLVYDGDIYSNDGTLTRKYGIVDLGSLTYTYDSQYQRFTASVTGLTTKSSRATQPVCGKYECLGHNERFDADWDKVLYVGSGLVLIHDHSYTDPTEFKSDMSGVYLVYELAAPTTSQLLPFQSPQIAFKDGTEEFIDDREVPIPVGNNSVYTDIPDFMESGYLAETRDNADTARHDLNALGLTIQNGKICQVYLKET